MRFAIVDDEEVFRLQVADSIYSIYGRESADCFLYSDGSELIASFENGFKLDAVFLDIEMKNVDGMTAAKAIRRYSKDIPIIFLTSHTEMAMDGYEVDAFRFLAKPVRKDKMLEALNDLEKKLRIDEKIILRSEGEEVICSVSDLIYVEAANNSVRFVFKHDSYEQRMKFTEAIRVVDDVGMDFFKCHRSYYVNLVHVKKLEITNVVMDNGDVIPVARSVAQDMKRTLFDFIRRTGR